MSWIPTPPSDDLASRELVDLPRDPDGRVDLDELALRLAPVDLLESARGAGWSYLVPHEGPVLRDDGHRTTLHGVPAAVSPAGTVALGSDPFAAVDDVAAALGAHPEAPPAPDLPDLSGGLVGALAYDLARRVERLPAVATADRTQPHLHLRAAAVVVAVSPDRDRAVAMARPNALYGDGPADRLARLAERLAAHARRPLRRPPDRSAPRQVVTTSLDRDAHLAAVAAALEAIATGRAFQVNLAQRLTARWPGDTTTLYRALRARSPAPLGAALPGIGVASISPETFLQVAGRQVTTRPIKGTRPRAQEPALDAALADDLATAAKDRAENVMIVDLQRNDLGRVCEPGSVRAPRLAEVEGHPTVWHLVSTVTGELRPGTGFGELLRATFPCGSITGAPKVAAMGLIERLEPVRRGWYCGALGYLAPGAAHLSVAIRTATLRGDGRTDYHAGGGIVADSEPIAEHAETLDKAAAFLRAVAAVRISPAPREGGAHPVSRRPADVEVDA